MGIFWFLKFSDKIFDIFGYLNIIGNLFWIFLTFSGFGYFLGFSGTLSFLGLKYPNRIGPDTYPKIKCIMDPNQPSLGRS